MINETLQIGDIILEDNCNILEIVQSIIIKYNSEYYEVKFHAEDATRYSLPSYFLLKTYIDRHCTRATPEEIMRVRLSQ